MIQIDDLVSIDPGAHGGWRLHARKAAGKRPRTTHHKDLGHIAAILLEMRVGDCTSLQEIAAQLPAIQKEIVAQIVRGVPVKAFDDMDHDERLHHFATGRVSVCPVVQLDAGTMIVSWVGKVRGKIIGAGKSIKYSNPLDAKRAALEFWERCRAEARERGLL